MKKVIKIDGGIGRVIALSGVVKEGDIVVTSFPEVFFGRNEIKVYPLSHPYLFEDIVYNNNWVEVEPYNDAEYYRNGKHISAVFNKLIYGDLEEVAPKMDFQSDEINSAKEQISNWKKEWGVKKIVMFQPFGSNITQDISKRAMTQEFAQKVIDKIKKVEGEYEVIYIKGEDHPELKNCKVFPLQLRQIFALANGVDKFIGVDSFLQHLAGAINKSALVFWTGTSVNNLGYSIHKNISIGSPLIIANRIPMNNPNVINKKYDWNNKYLKEVENYIK